MRVAIAGWHYRHRSMAENIRYFAAAGYDVFSALGKDFAEAFQNPGEPDEIAAAIRESGCAFTVHYGIADPADREATAAFYRSILIFWHGSANTAYWKSYLLMCGIRKSMQP